MNNLVDLLEQIGLEIETLDITDLQIQIASSGILHTVHTYSLI